MHDDSYGIRKRKLIEGILGSFRAGFVVVEGKHDVATLARLGVSAVRLGALPGKVDAIRAAAPKATFYIVMDMDRGGADKEGRAISFLTSVDQAIKYDTGMGRRFLKALGITSVEQAYKRVEELLGTQ
jgi:5S rRNA maturation endonuclease (ribonuclease M5)